MFPKKIQYLRNAVKNYLADFFRYGSTAQLFQKKFPKRTKKDLFVSNKVKNGPKGHIIDQKGLKMYEKGVPLPPSPLREGLN